MRVLFSNYHFKHKNFILATFFMLFTCFFISYTIAAPTIVSGPNTLIENALVTISGYEYGVKFPAAPIKWDNFEGGTSGATLSTGGWTNYSNNQANPTYSTIRAYTGAKSGYANLTSTVGFATAYTSFLATDKVYLNFKMYWEYTGTLAGVFKPIRISSQNQPYQGTPSAIAQYQPQNNWLYGGGNYGNTYNSADGIPSFSITPNPPANQWNDIETYAVLSSPGGAGNGVYWVRINSGPTVFMPGGNTRKAGVIDAYSQVMLPQMWANLTGTANVYVDSFYVDNTQARIMIANSSSWATATKREIQFPTAWLSTSITFRVNQGAFTSGENIYIFVVDADGVVSNGYGPIQIGSTGGSTRYPSPPVLIGITP